MNRLIKICAATASMSLMAMETGADLLSQHDIGIVLRTIRNDSTHSVTIVDTDNKIIKNLEPNQSGEINNRFKNFDIEQEDPFRTFSSGAFAIEFPEDSAIDPLWIESSFAIHKNKVDVEIVLNQVDEVLRFKRQLHTVKKSAKINKSEGIRFFVDVDIKPIISQSRVTVNIPRSSGNR